MFWKRIIFTVFLRIIVYSNGCQGVKSNIADKFALLLQYKNKAPDFLDYGRNSTNLFGLADQTVTSPTATSRTVTSPTKRSWPETAGKFAPMLFMSLLPVHPRNTTLSPEQAFDVAKALIMPVNDLQRLHALGTLGAASSIEDMVYDWMLKDRRGIKLRTTISAHKSTAMQKDTTNQGQQTTASYGGKGHIHNNDSNHNVSDILYWFNYDARDPKMYSVELLSNKQLNTNDTKTKWYDLLFGSGPTSTAINDNYKKLEHGRQGGDIKQFTKGAYVVPLNKVTSKLSTRWHEYDYKVANWDGVNYKGLANFRSYTEFVPPDPVIDKVKKIIKACEISGYLTGFVLALCEITASKKEMFTKKLIRDADILIHEFTPGDLINKYVRDVTINAYNTLYAVQQVVLKYVEWLNSMPVDQIGDTVDTACKMFQENSIEPDTLQIIKEFESWYYKDEGENLIKTLLTVYTFSENQTSTIKLVKEIANAALKPLKKLLLSVNASYRIHLMVLIEKALEKRSLNLVHSHINMKDKFGIDKSNRFTYRNKKYLIKKSKTARRNRPKLKRPSKLIGKIKTNSTIYENMDTEIYKSKGKRLYETNEFYDDKHYKSTNRNSHDQRNINKTQEISDSGNSKESSCEISRDSRSVDYKNNNLIKNSYNHKKTKITTKGYNNSFLSGNEMTKSDELGEFSLNTNDVISQEKSSATTSKKTNKRYETSKARTLKLMNILNYRNSKYLTINQDLDFKKNWSNYENVHRRLYHNFRSKSAMRRNKNNIIEESSYSDDENDIKLNLNDAVRHGDLNVSSENRNFTIREKYKINGLSSEIDEEGVFKNNIYRVAFQNSSPVTIDYY